MVMSTGPCPMSVLPVQVPTSVFIRSNSGETGLVFAGSAPNRETASSNVVAMILVFMIVLSWVVPNPSGTPLQRTARLVQDTRPALFPEKTIGKFPGTISPHLEIAASASPARNVPMKWMLLFSLAPLAAAEPLTYQCRYSHDAPAV